MKNRAYEMANFLRIRRQELGITQIKLSQIIGLEGSRGQYISNCERGTCQFPVDYITKLSEALQVSEETILNIFVLDYKKTLQEHVGKAQDDTSSKY